MDVPAGESGVSRQVRLLLADDSTVERLALAHFLRRCGYWVDEVEDGKSALSHLQNREVDLLLLDLQMPNMSGFEVLNYLEKHRRGLPVLLLSGMAVDEIQIKMHRLATHELPPLFLKPVDPDQLLKVIDLKLSGQLPDIYSANSASLGQM